jgi:lysophospholipase L1-like esterase
MWPFACGSVATPKLRLCVVEGDSISDSMVSDYPGVFLPNASPRVAMLDFAVAGSTLADAIARQATVDQVLACNTDAPYFIFTAMIGGNGFASAGTQALLDQIESLRLYYLGRKTAGYNRVVGITWTPRTTPAFNAARAQVNTAIRTWVGTAIDRLADFALDATMGPDAAASDTSLYSDGIHPTALGHSLLEPVYRAAVNG